MGKSQKGKELGTGISQRKDGLYTGRVTDPRTGKRIQKYFSKLQECRKWAADTQYEIAHGNVLYSENPIFEKWFLYWLEKIKKPEVKESTLRLRQNLWKNHIQPVIGNLKIQDIKPLHCSEVLNIMTQKGLKYSIVDNVRCTMHDCFECAVDNHLIVSNPITRNVKVCAKKGGHIRALTVKEQSDFLNRIKTSIHYNAFAFALQTGLRVGELKALTWDDIDFEQKILHVNQTVTTAINGSRKIDIPKTPSSIRSIPLTEEAINILIAQKEQNAHLKVIKLELKNIIFLNRVGNISTTKAYNRSIRDYCKKYNVEPFSMHSLRHTFATRCIEAGIKPNYVQKMLGHSSIVTTMDTYVHTSIEESINEIAKFDKYINVV